MILSSAVAVIDSGPVVVADLRFFKRAHSTVNSLSVLHTGQQVYVWYQTYFLGRAGLAFTNELTLLYVSGKIAILR